MKIFQNVQKVSSGQSRDGIPKKGNKRRFVKELKVCHQKEDFVFVDDPAGVLASMVPLLVNSFDRHATENKL